MLKIECCHLQINIDSPRKRLFSNSICNSIFLWYESENIYKKGLNPKFQLIPIDIYKFYMIMCIDIALKTIRDNGVSSILVNENLYDNCFYFTLKWFLLKFLWGNVFLAREIQVDFFIVWECPLYKIVGYTFKLFSLYKIWHSYKYVRFTQIILPL